MSEDVKTLLEKLYKETGLKLEISEDEVDDDTSLRLQELLLSVKDHTRRDLFWQSLLLGQLSREEMLLLSHRFHMDLSARRVLFLVAFFEPVSDMTKSLIATASGKRDEVVLMDERHIAILKQTDGDMEELKGEAHVLYDMISAEAMGKARIAYDTPKDDAYDLCESFRHCEASLKLSGFLSGDTGVISCGDMSYEKLLYSVPEEAAREFLSERVPDFDVSALDSEMKNTIATLFENELNIADTAKALFIHRNTLVYRLEKFQKQTGLDLKKFDDAMVCRAALILASRC